LYIPIQLPVKTQIGPSERVNQWSLKGTSIAAKQSGREAKPMLFAADLAG
jgi:hypothetical protein